MRFQNKVHIINYNAKSVLRFLKTGKQPELYRIVQNWLKFSFAFLCFRLKLAAIATEKIMEKCIWRQSSKKMIPLTLLFKLRLQYMFLSLSHLFSSLDEWPRCPWKFFFEKNKSPPATPEYPQKISDQSVHRFGRQYATYIYECLLLLFR